MSLISDIIYFPPTLVERLRWGIFSHVALALIWIPLLSSLVQMCIPAGLPKRQQREPDIPTITQYASL